jgi:hypothetical protein
LTDLAAATAGRSRVEWLTPIAVVETKQHCPKTHPAIAHLWFTPLMVGLDDGHLSQKFVSFFGCLSIQFFVSL